MTRRATASRHHLALALLLLPLASGAALAQPGPWARTETRQPCASFDKYRQPFFGDTHVHTAVLRRTRCSPAPVHDPRGAYRFAQGQPDRPAAVRRAGQRRPAPRSCAGRSISPPSPTTPSSSARSRSARRRALDGYDSPECVSARAQLAAPLPALPSVLPPLPVIQFLLSYGVLNPPQRY